MIHLKRIADRCLELVAGRKTENSSEEPNNCEKDCFLCKWLGDVDVCGRCRNRNLFAEADTEPTISKMEQDGKDHGMWVKDRNPNEKEFIENYVRNHHAAEFVVMTKNADRPTTLYHTSEGYWIDDNGDFYDVIAWTTLPKFDE